MSIAEVQGIKEDRIEVRGLVPKVMERLRLSGIPVPQSAFEEVVDVNL